MAFQTNVLSGGAWVTRTIDLQTVLKKPTPPEQELTHTQPPDCGLLTRTVAESLLFESILPVRLRGLQYNDVALIGPNDVQIFELRQDGQLKEVARKRDLGSRIRSAAVVGSFNIKEGRQYAPEPPVKMEDGVTVMESDSGPVGKLPPQMLILVLENGRNVFLFLQKGQNGKLEFVTVPAHNFSQPRWHLEYPGFHLVVDPSSRYMALACAQDYFVVFELQSHDVLDEEYRAGRPLKPVTQFRARGVQGVIHQVHFLYPRPEDVSHIILLLIIVRNGRSRMVTYEWALGDDLEAVLAEDKVGHRMPPSNQMPVLIIPLTVKSSFMVISPDEIAVCTGILHGAPNFEAFERDDTPPTPNHYGLEDPLWTAWSRPVRLGGFFYTRDCVYLAREDGVVLFVEADREGAMDRTTHIHTFDSNISGAFACMFDMHADILLLGSDSGPGAIWKVPARAPPTRTGTLPNWSPCVDFVTTYDCSINQPEDSTGQPRLEPKDYGRPQKPDRAFGTSGHGINGSITEYRYGLKAGLGLDLDVGHSVAIKAAWLFPSTYGSGTQGYHLLLTVMGGSVLLLLSEDFSQTESISPSLTYDISTPTLAVAETRGFLIQVTAAFVVLLSLDECTRFRYDEILPAAASLTILDACAVDEFLAFSTYDDACFQIHTYWVDLENRSLTRTHTFDVAGEVTCLSFGPGHAVMAGIWKENRAFLGRGQPQLPMDQGADAELAMTDISQGMASQNSCFAAAGAIGAIQSIVSAWGAVVMGTRSGEVVKLTDAGFEYEKFGTSAAKITCGQAPGSTEPTVLVACDGNLVQVRSRSAGSALFDLFRPKDKLRVWPVDLTDLAGVAPPVDYGVVVDLPASGTETTQIMMVTGSRILLAELQHQPGPVHRHIPIGGTPMKIIYSQTLQCLIAAVSKDEGPTLVFVDPDTGANMGMPVDRKTKLRVDSIQGLEQPGDRIHELVEWEFKKVGKTWRYLIVSTGEGRILTLGTEKVEAPGGGLPTIRYWLQFQKKGFDRPVYAVGTHEDGLVYCVGQTIHCDILDPAEKRLKTVKSFELASPATTLGITPDGYLMALTSQDSLEVIEFGKMNDETKTTQRHADPRRRNAIHMIEVAGKQPSKRLTNIVLVADRDCGVVGLWVPWEQPGKDCVVVLEAELPTSIRRFRRGRTRPVWEQGGYVPKYGRILSGADDAEVLGVSLDGTMHHFTMLRLDIWRFLRFVQNVALTNQEICTFTSETVQDYSQFDPEPNQDKGMQMHVDGDLLHRCLEKKALERLISWPNHEARFMELLRELEGGRYTAGFTGDEQYYGLAYDILEYFLRPVL